MNKRTSLAQVARAAGVSAAAVSLALRGAGRLAPATRLKIQQTATALNYCPNPLLASLASKRFNAADASGTPLAFLHRREKVPVYELLPEEFSGLQEYSRQLGFRLQSFELREFRDGTHATQVLYSRGVQGILLSPLIQPHLLPGMDWGRFALSGWGESMPELPGAPRLAVSRASVDHFGSVMQVWEEAVNRGYHRVGIALLTIRPGSTDDLLRWGAAQAVLYQMPRRQRIPVFVPGSPSDRIDFSGELLAWIERYRPDAVIGFNGLFLALLRGLGLRVPEDLGFAGLHASGRPKFYDGVVNVESGSEGVRLKSIMVAVDLLDQEIRHHQYGLPHQPRQQTILPDWVEGDTLPTQCCDRSQQRARLEPQRE